MLWLVDLDIATFASPRPSVLEDLLETAVPVRWVRDQVSSDVHDGGDEAEVVALF